MSYKAFNNLVQLLTIMSFASIQMNEINRL